MPKLIICENKICPQCQAEFNRKTMPSGRLEAIEDFKIRQCCSQKCANLYFVGDRHHNYKDGFRRGHDWGYLRYTDGRYVHRVIMEESLNRALNNNEHIHHKNGDVTDNRIENLEIHSNSSHRRLHCQSQIRDNKGKFCN